ncbi:MAG TPA: metal-dependent hydrolase [Thermodesulfobacteriaceae bacterium]|nr:metal-dependent hydrolase [Thermodesulfobacteriaceae bacterium]
MSHDLSFFGHSAFRITTADGLRIWIDPWLDNPQSPGEPDSADADLVLITHAHGDHLGNCLSLARSPSTEVVAIHEIQQYLLARGLPNVTGMNIGGTYSSKGVSMTMVPALHSSSIQEGQDIFYGGEAAGFVIRLKDGFCIYHAGDTALFGDMALIRELYSPEVVIVPIGGHYVMGPREAAHACMLLRGKKAVPMHYGSFPVLTGTVDLFKKELADLGVEIEVVEMDPGDNINL